MIRLVCVIAAPLAAAALAGCATPSRDVADVAPACPAGESRVRTAQLYFAGARPPAPALTDAAFTRFVDREITPRFPHGLTVLDGGGAWRGDENRLIREAAKVVQIILPPSGDAPQRVAAVRAAYRREFARETVLVIQASCVPF
jgi:hypothetical protein